MFFGLFTLFVALAISSVAAYYSIVGMMAIFAAEKTAIAIMGVGLEVGKLVVASWTFQNWKTAPTIINFTGGLKGLKIHSFPSISSIKSIAE